MALAERTTAYPGVMAARLAEQDRWAGPPAGWQPPAMSTGGGSPGVRVVDGSRAALMADPVLSTVIDFG